ncbi:MAG: hypothetical protein R3C18_01460 [Planctomycetaceae bacterium]
MRHFFISAACFVSLYLSNSTFAQQSASDLFPETTVVYAEIAHPDALLKEVLEHSLLRDLKQSQPGEKLLSNADFVQFQVVLSFLELRLGMTWEEAVGALTKNGAAIGVDASTNGVGLVLHGESAEVVEELRSTLMQIATEEAEKKGKKEPYKTSEYRGVTVYDTGDGGFATYESWVLFTNNGKLGTKMIDRLLDSGEKSLTSNEQFASAVSNRGDHDFWAYANLSALRNIPKVQKALTNHAENPLVEVLVGGLQEVLRHTPYLTLNANLESNRFAIDANVPHDPKNVAEAREYWFGPNGQGSANPQLSLDGSILSLSSYRNVSEMWLRAGDLFDERMNDKLAEADSNLTTLFSGKDFGEDILGAVQPQVQLQVVRQQFAENGPVPAIKIPAFALRFHLKDPEASTRELRRTFQSLIGFLNVVGAQNGQPQMELDFANEQGVDLVSAHYVPDAGQKNSQSAPINFNFSPSVAFFGDRFVVASTRKLAEQLIVAESAQSAENNQRIDNTLLSIDTHALSDALKDNRSQLVAQNMLEKGNSREEAQATINAILEFLKFVNAVDFSAATNTESGTFGIHLEVR